MKNYVKKYKGCDVPDGATHVSDFPTPQPIEFYRIVNGEYQFFNIGCANPAWCKSVFNKPNKHAVPLPEQPMPSKAEWMPNVGDRIVICFDDVDINDLNENEIAINGMEVTLIGSLVNGVGQTIFVYDDNNNFSDCYPSEYFRPLKTAEEKRREAFIERARLILDKHDNYRAFFGAMFDDGFTAPDSEL